MGFEPVQQFAFPAPGLHMLTRPVSQNFEFVKPRFGEYYLTNSYQIAVSGIDPLLSTMAFCHNWVFWSGDVLVSHKHRFIYLKTFKTAGTSVEQALEHACRPDGSAPDGSYYNGPEGIVAERGGREDGNPYRSHAAARFVQRQLGPHIWDGYTKIATVRNPFEKAVSMFWHQHSRTSLIDDPTDAQSAISAFRHWIASGVRLPRDHLRVSIDNTVIIDLPIRHECLEEDLAQVGRRLGLSPAPLNRFHGELRQLKLDHRAYYDAETAERVAAHYALDFEAFGYDLNDWQSPAPPAVGKSAA